MKHKLVIVMRHDLSMRMGKAVAQGGHAAMMFLVHGLLSGDDLTETEITWFQESAMKKICLRVESEQELLDIEQRALAAGLKAYMVMDAGLTEFAGPTRTCLAIGPDEDVKIDAITGNLKLL